MLTPDYLDTLPDALVELFQQVEDDILRDIARRINKMGELTPTAVWQAWRLEQTRAVYSDVVRTLAKYSGKADAEIRRILQDAGATALAADDTIYRVMGFAPSDISTNPALLNLLNAGYRQTLGSWKNLTRTTANTVTRQFEDALDRAWLQVSSGAFDYKTAVKRAVDDLASKGIKAIRYPSGHTDTLEVAARRAVLTGVNQTAAKLQIARADEMGCDLVETTAHPGARPSHAEWQGQVFSRSGRSPKYPPFERTGYGTGAGLCGWNCRHSFYPFFEGLSDRAYSRSYLEDINARDIDYRGKKYSRYEINQQQRALERRVRAAKRKYLAEDAAGLDTSAAAAELNNARRKLDAFVRDTGGRLDSARIGVSGFGRSAAARATAGAKAANVELSRLRKLDQTRQARLTENPSLALPNAGRVVLESDKFIKYLFNKKNPRGYAKGIAFTSRLGYDINNWEELKDEIHSRAALYPARQTGDAGHGMKYEQLMILYGKKNMPTNVVVGWIEEDGIPRMTSTYIKEVNEHDN